jgi:hypothetical protein
MATDARLLRNSSSATLVAGEGDWGTAEAEGSAAFHTAVHALADQLRQRIARASAPLFQNNVTGASLEHFLTLETDPASAPCVCLAAPCARLPVVHPPRLPHGPGWRWWSCCGTMPSPWFTSICRMKIRPCPCRRTPPWLPSSRPVSWNRPSKPEANAGPQWATAALRIGTAAPSGR